MKSRILFVLGFFLLTTLAAAPARAALSVFACEPEWGALAEELGGELVKVRNGTNALQDAHFISARPSLIAAVRRADLVICTGADLEVAWLPILLRQSGNRGIQPGRPGYLAAADFIPKLEVPTKIDRALGDIHPQGNPHVVGNPHNLTLVARQLSARLATLDPGNRARYERRLEDFEARWQAAISGWEAAAAPLKSLPLVVQHKTWVYLIDWLGLDVVTTLEPRPGIPPSTSHLRAVLANIEDTRPRLIINAAYEHDRPSRWLAKRSGIPAVTLPYTVGGSEEAKDLFSLFDQTIKLMLEAIK